LSTHTLFSNAHVVSAVQFAWRSEMVVMLLYRLHEFLHTAVDAFHLHSGWLLQSCSLKKRYGHWFWHEPW